MSTSARQNHHSFIRSAMTNDRSRFPLRINHFINPILPIGESSPSFQPRTRCRSTTKSTETSPKPFAQQTYTFSNPPRELARNVKLSHHNRLSHRVSSAPIENSSQISPRSLLNQQKSSSANQSTTLRSHGIDYYPAPPARSIHRHPPPLKDDEQEKSSLHALMKEQQRSKVPRAVQNRRIILLFHRSPATQEENASSSSSSSSPIQPIPPRERSTIITNHPVQILPPSNKLEQQHQQSNDYQFFHRTGIDPMNNLEPEIADSLQLAAILKDIQFQDDWNPNENSSSGQATRLDPKKYEYVVSNLSDTATYRLSPRTLKPNEELAARSRFSQYYRAEMRSSANAQIPPLMASIVTENNLTLGANTAPDKTFTFRVGPNGTIKADNSFDNHDPMDSNIESEQIQLCYDATLNGFYDPNTGLYYELTSA